MRGREKKKREEEREIDVEEQSDGGKSIRASSFVPQNVKAKIEGHLD